MAGILLLGMSSSLSANKTIVIAPGEDRGDDVIKVLLRGNGGSCSVLMNSAGIVENTDCIRLTNSEKIKVHCTKKKALSKTEKEVYDYLVAELSS